MPNLRRRGARAAPPLGTSNPNAVRVRAVFSFTPDEGAGPIHVALAREWASGLLDDANNASRLTAAYERDPFNVRDAMLSALGLLDAKAAELRVRKVAAALEEPSAAALLHYTETYEVTGSRAGDATAPEALARALDELQNSAADTYQGGDLGLIWFGREAWWVDCDRLELA
jgi:hypothetical protein